VRFDDSRSRSRQSFRQPQPSRERVKGRKLSEYSSRLNRVTRERVNRHLSSTSTFSSKAYSEIVDLGSLKRSGSRARSSAEMLDLGVSDYDERSTRRISASFTP